MAQLLAPTDLEVLREEARGAPRRRGLASALAKAASRVVLPVSSTERLEILKTGGGARGRKIPIARSKFEAGIRKLIGGGEMNGRAAEPKMLRGGRSLSDALITSHPRNPFRRGVGSETC
jgi:hypothetical protein